jgi:hypothetical protein
MSNAPSITYTARPDTTPEGEVSALANVYAFILQCGEEKSAAGMSSTNGNAAKDSKHKVRPTRKHSR